MQSKLGLAAFAVSVAILSAGIASAASVSPEQLARAKRFLSLPMRIDAARLDDLQWLSEGALSYRHDGKVVTVNALTNQVTEAEEPAKAAPTKEEEAQLERKRPRPVGTRYPRFAFGSSSILESGAPDGSMFLTLREQNLWLRSTTDDSARQVTRDGDADHEWDFMGVVWSADSRSFAIARIDNTQVTRIPLVRWLNPVPTVSYLSSPLIDTPLPRYQIFIGDAASGAVREVDVAAREENLGIPVEHFQLAGFTGDGRHLLVTKTSNDRLTDKLISIDVASGSSRTVIEEKTDTILFQSAHDLVPVQLGSGRLIWKSDRGGWLQFYMYAADGRLLRKLTPGAYPVSDVIHADERSGWLYFTASPDRNRPYDVHLMRVQLRGGTPQQLTKTPGQHHITFAPGGRFYLDEHSSLTRAPVAELHSVDGALVRVLAKSATDPSQLWEGQLPEEFTATAADDKSVLYGVIYKPADFNPAKQYPVVQYVYGGPGVSVVQHQFNPGLLSIPPALAQLGFITFAIDSRGTPGRSKAFEQVAYHDYGTHQIEDYLSVLKQMSAARPYLDMDRVGVFGRSYGGYTTLRAMLLAPDVYRVGVAQSPMTGDEIFVKGLVSGLPTSSEPAQRGRVVPIVDRLRGRLLLTMGTNDSEIPFDVFMKLTQAFIRTGKRIDMTIFPEANHFYRNEGSYGVPDSPPYVAMSRTYEAATIFDYFVDHLANGLRDPLQLPQ